MGYRLFRPQKIINCPCFNMIFTYLQKIPLFTYLQKIPLNSLCLNGINNKYEKEYFVHPQSRIPRTESIFHMNVSLRIYEYCCSNLEAIFFAKASGIMIAKKMLQFLSKYLFSSTSFSRHVSLSYLTLLPYKNIHNFALFHNRSLLSCKI